MLSCKRPIETVQLYGATVEIPCQLCSWLAYHEIKSNSRFATHARETNANAAQYATAAAEDKEDTSSAPTTAVAAACAPIENVILSNIVLANAITNSLSRLNEASDSVDINTEKCQRAVLQCYNLTGGQMQQHETDAEIEH